MKLEFGQKIIDVLRGKTYRILKEAQTLEENRNHRCDIHIQNELRNNLLASKIHPETFGKYRNSNAGKTMVVMATGPTANYHTPIDNAKYIGVNKAFLINNINLDFLLIVDYCAVESYIDQLENFPNIEKFFGYYNLYHEAYTQMIPESIAYKYNAKRFVVYPYWQNDVNLRYGYEPRIDYYPLHCYFSSIIPAVQFALFTNPSKIYLVGCDCSNIGHFDNSPTPGLNNTSVLGLLNEWKMVKNIRDLYYPDTQIISMNPIGLKGLFEDVYTENYLKDNPQK